MKKLVSTITAVLFMATCSAGFAADGTLKQDKTKKQAKVQKQEKEHKVAAKSAPSKK